MKYTAADLSVKFSELLDQFLQHFLHLVGVFCLLQSAATAAAQN
jgi:hypothetical protein